MSSRLIKDEVAVIIPTLNSSIYLSESIESIINQSWKNIKIYILDGGSSDITLDIAYAYAKKYDNFEVIIRPNVHPCKRVDECIQNITSPYIALQHSDDISYKSRIETQIQAFKSDPELAVCSAWYRSFWHQRMQKPTHSGGETVHSKPFSHEEIKCELLFWWVMHSPTLMLDRVKAISANLKFENNFIYINDYWQTVENINNLKYTNIGQELSAYRLHFSGDGAKNSEKIIAEEAILKEQVLKKFGFTFTPKELATHLKIKIIPDGKLLCNTQDEYDEVIAWLYSLINQNEQLKAFNVENFNSVVKMIIKEVAKD
jgi:glycosyltransferase involved in cell wall biosynthesis